MAPPLVRRSLTPQKVGLKEGALKDEFQVTFRIRKSVFPFLKLPPEIRNEIYQHLFERDGWLKLRSANDANFPAPPWLLKTDSPREKMIKNRDHQRRHFNWSAMTKVNRQMRMEAGPILYGQTKFEVPNKESLLRFLDVIGKTNVRRLKAISLADVRSIRTESADEVFSRLAKAKRLSTLKLCAENGPAFEYFKQSLGNAAARSIIHMGKGHRDTAGKMEMLVFEKRKYDFEEERWKHELESVDDRWLKDVLRQARKKCLRDTKSRREKLAEGQEDGHYHPYRHWN